MDSPNWQGVVLYDDACEFCRRWIPFWGRTLARRGIGIAPLQAPWVQDRLGLSDAELSQDLRLLLRDGQQVVGADVYRYVMRRIWWAWPLYVLACLPVARQIFDWSYRTFANNRLFISQSCGLRGVSHQSR